MQGTGQTTIFARIPELDGLRGIAVSLVLFHHLVVHSGMGREVLVDKATFALAAPGWLGVDLFFVLSGFLITGILYDSKTTEGYFRNFYGRRALRIFPLYFGFLALSLVTAPALMPADAAQNLIDGQTWFWTYLSNVYIVVENGWPEPQHLNHFWSLAIEEQFYLIWPLAVLACSGRRLVHLSAACIGAALLLRLWLPFGMSPLDSYVLLPTRMDALAAGGLVALLVRSDTGLRALRTWALPVLVISAVMLPALLAGQWGWTDLYGTVVALRYTVAAVAASALIGVVVTADRDSWARKILSLHWLKTLGLYSYGLYVLHHPIIFILRDAGFDARVMPQVAGSTLPGVLLFGAVGFGLSMMLAMLSYHYWELPFLRLKRFFAYGKRPRAPAVDNWGGRQDGDLIRVRPGLKANKPGGA